ncbi:glycerate kinase [Corynebacterium confusum]|uniref:glycerate kinase n=1 Tax=uncultured Corynebacterium sp. TaxID=159447 RepID=UPI0025DA77A5|nr:glycerate kinase [uncultured Corynebacterium sp.]
MHIVVAPDSFKGTANSSLAAAGLASGIRQELPEATVVTCPLADGGEGTAHTLATAASLAGRQLDRVCIPSVDALGRLTEAEYYLDPETATAYIDVAAATGLPAVIDSPDPLRADSFGTGALIADAETRGAKSIVLGLGGSATIDGGIGILCALGAAPHDARGLALAQGPAELVRLGDIDTAQLNYKAGMLDYTLLADTRCTPREAPAMYGPQKGANREQVALLTGALLSLCEFTEEDPTTEYFGAAGAIPVGLSWMSRILWGNDEHVRVLSGAEYVADALDLDRHLAEADVVVTGEGRFDAQSLTGKAVGTVADRAAASPNAPRVAIAAGQFADDAELPAGSFHAALPADGEMPERLRAAGQALARQFQEELGS